MILPHRNFSNRMALRPFLLFSCFFLATLACSFGTDTTVVRFSTSLGPMDVQLYSDESPLNVANFLSYVNSGAYTNSIIHRSVVNFVVQGGGYFLGTDGYLLDDIPANAPVVGEHVISNTRGTLAMALSSGPNTATNQWFFNTVDNSASLDGTADGGPFTVVGVITNAAGLAVMDAIAAVPIYDASGGNSGSPFGALPLINYVNTNAVTAQNFVTIFSITTVPPPLQYSTWQSAKFTTSQSNTPSFIAPTATPWNDRTTNLLKYFCDINPSAPMSVADQSKLPTVGKTTIGSTTYMTLSFQQNAASLTDLTYTVQTSSDLQTWTSVTSPTTVEVGSNPTTGDAIMQVQIPVSGAEQFIRLSLTQQPGS
jgi:peptidyl-prolyl cis-trans isomerase A (cyclophilin A)